MGLAKIDNCREARCPDRPEWLKDARSDCNCPVCERCVYNCSPSPGEPDWQRIAADTSWSPPELLKVDDIVRITNGTFENFQAWVCRVNQEDQAACIYIQIFGRHLPFWISQKNLELVERKK